MNAVPSEPEEFFTSYLRARFDSFREHATGLTSVGSLTFRVPEVGEWSLRVREGDLEVIHEMEDDVMLQITVPKDDFAVLVSGSIERAGASARLPQTSGAPLRALAAKPDVARMIRHVPGSVLFVARDGDRRHLLLVTPGHRKADLASAECTIECKLSDMVDAQSKGLPPMQLFTAGKLKITGNIQIAMALAAVLA